MKRLIAKTLLIGLIVSLVATPAQAMGWDKIKPVPATAVVTWSQWFKDGLSSIKTSMYESSTETKVLVGCVALAAAGISYLIYRYLNPTDKELIDESNKPIFDAERYVTFLPITTKIADAEYGAQQIQVKEITEQLLSDIYHLIKNNYYSPAYLLEALHSNKRSLVLHQKNITDRLNKRREQKSDVIIMAPLVECQAKIISLIEEITRCIDFLNIHSHYLRMLYLEADLNWYSPLMASNKDVSALTPLIRNMAKNERFPFIKMVDWIDDKIENLESELSSSVNPQLQELYMLKRAHLRQLKSGLEVLRTTILGSQDYKEDLARKDKYDAEQRRLKIERQRLAQEAKKAADERRAREARIRIEQQRLQLEREKNQREREAHQQQNQNAGRTQQVGQAECRVQ